MTARIPVNGDAVKSDYGLILDVDQDLGVIAIKYTVYEIDGSIGGGAKDADVLGLCTRTVLNSGAVYVNGGADKLNSTGGIS